MKKVLILYTELAGYTIACIEALIRKHNAELILVRYPVNSEAPFQFNIPDTVRILDRNRVDEAELLRISETFQPDIILCSGWNDKMYTAVCRKWRTAGIPVVLAMDNKWQGTIRQYAACLLAPFTLRKTFSHCWVPGESQKNYVLKLGFQNSDIAKGFYACDYNHFSEVYGKSTLNSDAGFPHRFVYAGRYYGFKGILDLWQAFAAMKEKSKSDWKLVCIGTGDITPHIHPDILHMGFLQPEEMADFMKSGGVFVLPSRIEPWGVVVQEYAAAGFPLLLSNKVGAAEAFLDEKKNGFSFAAGDVDALELTLKKITELPDDELRRMSAASHQVAAIFTPEVWSDTLLSFIKTK